jgi:hypothetical protein
LLAGLSFLTNTKEDEIRFSKRLREYLKFTNEVGIKPIKFSQVKDII